LVARLPKGPVGDQIRLFIILAVTGTISAVISGLLGAMRFFYASLGFLVASPYIASLAIYLRERSRRL